MQRREFNQLALQTAIGSLLLGCSSVVVAPKERSDSAAYPEKVGSKGRIVLSLFKPGGACAIRLVDWETFEFHDFDVPLNVAHSLVQDKSDKDVIYAFEVFGSGLRANLKTGSVVKIDHRRGQGMFNGHGAILGGNGEFIACTEIAKAGASVRVRSTKDLSVIAELPQECGLCHQAIVLPGTMTLVSGGRFGNKGAFTFYDFSTKKLVLRVETPNPILHLTSLSSSEVIGTCVADDDPISMERMDSMDPSKDSYSNVKKYTAHQHREPAPIAYASMDGKSRFLLDDTKKDLFASTFGVTKGKNERFISAHTAMDKVLIWKNFEIEKMIDVPKPKNVQISPDGEEMMILGGGQLYVFSTKDFSLLRKTEDWPYVVSTSHYG